MHPILIKLQDVVIKTRKIFPFAQIYRLIYLFLTYFFSRLIALNRSVICVYLDKKDKKDLVCGSSDIDYIIVTKNDIDYYQAYKIFNFIYLTKKFIPIFGAHMILKKSEFINALKMGIDVKYIKKEILFKRKEFSLPDISLSYDNFKNWPFFFFNGLSHIYYDVLKIKTINMVRQFCSLIIKFFKSHSLENIIISKYDFCKKILEKADPDNPQIKTICNYYLLSSRGVKIQFNDKAIKDLTSAYVMSLNLLQKYLEPDLSKSEKRIEFELALTKSVYEHVSEPYIFDDISPQIIDFCKKQNGTIKSAVLASAPCTDFGYFVYFILNENLNDLEYLEIISAAKNITIFSKLTHLRKCGMFNLPKILKSNSLNYINTFHDPLCIPIEYYYLKRHGKIIYGENVIENLIEPDKKFLIENILRFASYLPIKTRRMFVNTRPISHLISLLYCTLPSTKLLLEHGIITTTAKETFVEYIEHYGKEADWLRKTHENYINNTNPQKIKISEGTTEEWYKITEKILDDIRSKTSELLKDVKI